MEEREFTGKQCRHYDMYSRLSMLQECSAPYGVEQSRIDNFLQSRSSLSSSGLEDKTVMMMMITLMIKRVALTPKYD